VRTKKSVEKGAHAHIFSRPIPEEKGTCGFVQGVPTGARRAISAKKTLWRVQSLRSLERILTMSSRSTTVVDLIQQLAYQSSGFGTTSDFGVTASRTPNSQNSEKARTVDCGQFDPSDHFGNSGFISLERSQKYLFTLTPESRKGLSSVKLNGGNTSWRSVEDPRAIVSCKGVRGLRRVPLQSPISSIEIGVVGSNPMRVLRSCANFHFGNSRIGAKRDFRVTTS
jgi:hypothetical protein